MATQTELTVEKRIAKLLAHLGIEQAHFGARSILDWRGLVEANADIVASLALLCPDRLDLPGLAQLSARLSVINGDSGSWAEGAARVLEGLPEARRVILSDYAVTPWTDPVADRPDEVLAMMNTLLDRDKVARLEGESEGEVAGIAYTMTGSGPALLLLPLALAPTQWERVVSELRKRFCVIMLGGRHLGYVAILEARGQAPGYRRMVATLLDEMDLSPGQSVLDVGSGSGALTRWIAQRTNGANTIIGTDVSGYMLREAASLAAEEGLSGVVDFKEGDAESLPFADGQFDVTLSVTVLEEVDADKVLLEMRRVTKPGGRVAVIVRATDVPWVVNVASPDLKEKAELPGGNVGPSGCADASLYARFHEAGLADLRLFPYQVPFGTPSPLLAGWLLNVMAARPGMTGQAARLSEALRQAMDDGTYLVAFPHHCAVGTKPN